MRRLKNIAEYLEALLKKCEREKTLNLQSLEDRVLYSAVPLPVDLAVVPADSSEVQNAIELEHGATATNVSLTLDRLDTLISSEMLPVATPEVLSAETDHPLAVSIPTPDAGSNAITDEVPGGVEESPDLATTPDDASLVSSLHRTPDTPVAAGKVTQVSLGVGSNPTLEEGDYLEILDTSLSASGVAGETIVLNAASSGGTLYQNGDVVSIGDEILVQALIEGDVIFIPDLNFSGNVTLNFERIAGGVASSPDNYLVQVTVLGTADDGVAILGDEFRPVDAPVELTSSGSESDVVALEDGGYVIVWNTNETDPDIRTVRAQRFTDDGLPVGGEIVVAPGQGGTSSPSVAALADGGFVIAWQHGYGVEADINVQRFDERGDRVELDGVMASGNSVDLITSIGTEQIQPAIVGTSDGGFAVVYQSQADSSAAGERDLQMVLFDADGSRSVEIQVNGAATASPEEEPRIIELEDGRLLVAWVDRNGLNVVRGAIFDPVGNVIREPFEIGGSVLSDTGFEITAIKNNGFAATWQTRVIAPGNRRLVNVAVFDASGILQNQRAVDVRRPMQGISAIADPTIQALDDGTLLIGIQRSVPGNPLDVSVTRLSESLSSLGEPVIVHTEDAGEQTDLSLAVLGNGRLVTVYQSDSGVATQQSVMSVSTNGSSVADLNISPVIYPLAVNVSNGTSQDALVSVSIGGLVAGTQLFADGALLYTYAGGEDFNFTANVDSEIGLSAPARFVGALAGQLSVTTVHGMSQPTVVSDFQLIVNNPSLNGDVGISGTVAHDTNIDGSIEDDTGLENVRVTLFEKIGGNGGPSRFRTVSFTTTDHKGEYFFEGLNSGDEYLVSVDSKTIELPGTAAASAWAQQTYSSAGGITSDFFLDLVSVTATDGFLIGGADAAVSDTFDINGGNQSLRTIQHANYFTAVDGSSALDNIDFGFNFNVVNNLTSGSVPPDPGTPAQVSQGSLHQFLINANAIAGENRMVFVPGVAANASANGERWWRLEINELLPEIRDDLTIIDGRAWQEPSAGSSRSLVRYDLNPVSSNDGYIDNVGVDNLKLGDPAQASISAVDAPDLELVNASGAALDYGIKVRPDASNTVLEGVEINNIAIRGFGNGQVVSGNIIVDGRGQAGGIELEVTGFKLSGSVIGVNPVPDVPPPTTPGNLSHNVVVLSASGADADARNLITNNLIAQSRRAGISFSTPPASASNATRYWMIENNSLLLNGAVGESFGDGIDLRHGTTDISVVGNLIQGSKAFGIDTALGEGGYLIRSNSIFSNGSAVNEAGGIRLAGAVGSTVVGNLVQDNLGSGVNVSGVFSSNGAVASTNNLISQNEFQRNGGLAIDLGATDSLVERQRGDGLTLVTGPDGDTGNNGIDAPEIESVTLIGNRLHIVFGSDGSLEDADGSGNLDPAEIGSIELYLSAAGDGDSDGGNDYGEGASFIASVNGSQLTSVNGKWLLILEEPAFGWPVATFAETDSITAIAIDASSNTSEFGSNRSVNFAPVAITSSITVLEDVPRPFVASDFQFTDANTAHAAQYDHIEINSLPDASKGVLLFDGGAVTVGLKISRTDIGRLAFMSTLNYFDAVALDAATFEFSVSDGIANGNVVTMTVMVSPVNDAPTLAPIAVAPIEEGQAVTIDVLSAAADVDSDVATELTTMLVDDGDPTTTNNNDLFAVDPVTNEIRLITGYEFTGAGPAFLTVDVAVTDGSLQSNTRTIVVQVNNFNEAPTLDPITVAPIEEGQTVTIDVLSAAADVDNDVATELTTVLVDDGDPTTTNNNDLFVVDPVTNEISLITGYEFTGAGPAFLTVDVAVTDGSLLSNSQTITVQINNVNDAPVFAESTPDTIQVSRTAPIIIDLSATDPDLDPVTYRLVNEAAKAVFEINPQTGELKFIEPPRLQRYEVEVAADDGRGGDFPIRTVKIEISDFVVPNLVNSPPDTSADPNESDPADPDVPETIDQTTLAQVNPRSNNNQATTNGLKPTPVAGDAAGADDLSYVGEGFINEAQESVIDLGFYETYYQSVESAQTTELVSQQLADVYRSRRVIDSIDGEEANLAALFWQELDSSNQNYLRKQLDVNHAGIAAAAGGLGLLSAGMMLMAYSGGVAITTLATQLPAWKSLDISPLISAFDEDEESIHEIVDG